MAVMWIRSPYLHPYPYRILCRRGVEGYKHSSGYLFYFFWLVCPHSGDFPLTSCVVTGTGSENVFL